MALAIFISFVQPQWYMRGIFLISLTEIMKLPIYLTSGHENTYLIEVLILFFVLYHYIIEKNNRIIYYNNYI